MRNDLDYWNDALGEALFGIDKFDALTSEERQEVAEALSVSHEHYGMAFYSPPASDRLDQIESEWKSRYAALEREFAEYRNNAETAVKRALRQHSDTNVSIGKHGEVLRHEGRTEIIQ